MQTSALIMGIIPLLAFVIIDSFFGIKKALIGTVILAAIEAIFSIYLFSEIDSVTIFSLITVISLAGVSYKYKKDIYLKFQPVILSVIMAIILVISFIISKPLMYEMAIKYQDFFPREQVWVLNHPIIIKQLKLGTLTVGIGLLFHAACTAYAALKLSNWWWIAVRGIGFYLFTFLGFFGARLLG